MTVNKAVQQDMEAAFSPRLAEPGGLTQPRDRGLGPIAETETPELDLGQATRDATAARMNKV